MAFTYLYVQIKNTHESHIDIEQKRIDSLYKKIDESLERLKILAEQVIVNKERP